MDYDHQAESAWAIERDELRTEIERLRAHNKTLQREYILVVEQNVRMQGVLDELHKLLLNEAYYERITQEIEDF